MPVPPFRRAAEEGLGNQTPDGRSTAGSGRAKRKPKPTSKAKNRKKKVKARYAKAREDAQLAGVIPTTPDGAVRSERVDPRSQASAALPELVRQSLRESWATPDAAKPHIVAALLRPFYEDMTIVDKDGNMVTVPTSAKVLIELARTLIALDHKQYERDNPEAAGKAKGGGNTMSVQMNVQAAAVIRQMVSDGELGELDAFGTVPASTEPSISGNGRHIGEMEAGAAPESDQ